MTTEAPKVKALEWADETHWQVGKQADGGLEFYDLSGLYVIRERRERFVVRYLNNPITTKGKLKEAKAAAQADFERRILDALE